MAYRAGAALVNLEFKQVFPGTVHPTINHLSAWFFVPHVKITNALGEAYVARYLPPGVTVEEVYAQRAAHGPFSTRDSASRYFDVATVAETKAGRANQHGALHADLTDPRVEDPLAPARREFFLYRGVDYIRTPVEFNICFHCSNGGVRIDENAQSSLPGLYAAGEAAAGPHGANRLAGHMLTASQVFGRRAGRHAAAVAAAGARPQAPPGAVREAVAVVERLGSARGPERPSALVAEVRQLAWENMLVDVNAGTLAAAREGLAAAGERMAGLNVSTPADLVAALELRNMLVVGEALAGAMDLRRESRGEHYREDCPARDDEKWNRVIVVRQEGGRMKLEPELLDPDWPADERADDMGGIRWG
jgi:succinate dehydrogenase/fumarate reductase flavoprotein subunit